MCLYFLYVFILFYVVTLFVCAYPFCMYLYFLMLLYFLYVFILSYVVMLSVRVYTFLESINTYKKYKHIQKV